MKNENQLNAVNPFYQRVGEQYLARKKEEGLNPALVSQPAVSPQENKSVLTKEGYIYVPALGFYVAKERIYLEKDFNECQDLLHKENAKILNIDEARKFLIYTKKYALDIYNEILDVRVPNRSEFIDANFKLKGNYLYLHS